ncbi:hypothetical protein [Rhodococcus sp. NPDC058514]|uniref:hypothetical protein n=1 Tax=unclassified Rhodococcus (in: high G+C Gram-positive bacteria) TaxID=192944 RepID=UPI00364F1AF5
MGDGAAPRWGWTDTLVMVSIVATGVIVAGLLHVPGGSATDDTSAHSYVTPEVEYPVEIPGCESVAAPSEGEMFMTSISGEQSYDNPRYPWFSGPKATAMSEALREALPGGVELEYASPTESLLFEPIPVYSSPSQLPEGITEDDFGGSTSARGMLIRDSVRGSLWVTVRRWDKPVPECVAGQLDRRATYPDGTIVDTQDTWAEYDGKRNLLRTAAAYLPDRTLVTVQAGDEDSGTLPLTLEELSSLARTPGLSVTAAVPAGTPAPPVDCSGGGAGSRGERPTRDAVERVGRALDEAWRAHAPAHVTLDRALGSLQPAGESSACTTVQATGPGGSGRLSVDIGGGHELPAEPDEYDPSNAWNSTKFETLPDGSVVERDRPSIVTVTRPSGNQVRVSLSDVPPGTLLTVDQLQAIATAPGLELTR